MVYFCSKHVFKIKLKTEGSRAHSASQAYALAAVHVAKCHCQYYAVDPRAGCAICHDTTTCQATDALRVLYFSAFISSALIHMYNIIIYILQVNEKSCRLRMGAYRDGVKRKGDKIGMGV